MAVRIPGKTTGHDVTAVHAGRKVVAAAATAERLVSSSTPAKLLLLTAETDNTGVMAWGDSGVIATVLTRVGQPLLAGDSSPWIPVDDLYDIYLDATVNGDGCNFVYLT